MDETRSEGSWSEVSAVEVALSPPPCGASDQTLREVRRGNFGPAVDSLLAAAFAPELTEQERLLEERRAASEAAAARLEAPQRRTTAPICRRRPLRQSSRLDTGWSAWRLHQPTWPSCTCTANCVHVWRSCEQQLGQQEMEAGVVKAALEARVAQQEAAAAGVKAALEGRLAQQEKQAAAVKAALEGHLAQQEKQAAAVKAALEGRLSEATVAVRAASLEGALAPKGVALSTNMKMAEDRARKVEANAKMAETRRTPITKEVVQQSTVKFFYKALMQQPAASGQRQMAFPKTSASKW
eukprot:scaffold2.g7531.t1